MLHLIIEDKPLAKRPVVVLSVVAFMLLIAFHTTADEERGRREFTVKDSIQIRYIIDVSRRIDVGLQAEHALGAPIDSPDDKYFLLVTQRGVVSNNTLEATLWLFDRQSVWDYALGTIKTRPSPRRLATMAATSNTPVIYDVRWVDGSKRA